MGPGPACGELRRRQEKARGSFASRSRRRVCLLKGCGRSFVPGCWSQRYCSRSCREGADEWRRRKAAWEYRRSEEGKAKRAAQSRRRRERQRQEESRQQVDESDSAAESTQLTPREGHHPLVGDGDFCCDRPGCYVLFDRSRQSPLQCFCSSSCRNAMRRVRVRESQWRVRALLRRHVACSAGGQTPQRRCRL
jgi:hypothetical protein